MLWWPRSSGRGSASRLARGPGVIGVSTGSCLMSFGISLLMSFPGGRAATGPPQPTPACHHQGRTGGWRRSGRLGHGRRDGQRRDRLGLAWAAGSRLGHGGRRAGGGRRGRRLGRLDRPALVTPPMSAPNFGYVSSGVTGRARARFEWRIPTGWALLRVIRVSGAKCRPGYGASSGFAETAGRPLPSLRVVCGEHGDEYHAAVARLTAEIGNEFVEVCRDVLLSVETACLDEPDGLPGRIQDPLGTLPE